MSVARHALRLPRVGATLLESRIPRTSIAVANQRRWLRKPPPRDRAWAERKNEDDQHRRDLESAQQPIGSDPASQQQQEQQQQSRAVVERSRDLAERSRGHAGPISTSSITETGGTEC